MKIEYFQIDFFRYILSYCIFHQSTIVKQYLSSRRPTGICYIYRELICTFPIIQAKIIYLLYNSKCSSPIIWAVSQKHLFNTTIILYRRGYSLIQSQTWMLHPFTNYTLSTFLNMRLALVPNSFKRNTCLAYKCTVIKTKTVIKTRRFNSHSG